MALRYTEFEMKMCFAETVKIMGFLYFKTNLAEYQ